MARVVMVFEDTEDGSGKVRVEVTPKAETLFKMNDSGWELTAAQAYALNAVRSIREASKKEGPLLIKVPGLGR